MDSDCAGEEIELREIFELCLTKAKEYGLNLCQAYAHMALGTVAVSAADDDTALSQYCQAVKLWRDDEFVPAEKNHALAEALCGMAAVLFSKKQKEEAKKARASVFTVLALFPDISDYC